METILPVAGGVIAAVWGIVHLLPTRKVVAGLGDTSEDNRNIVMMEWIAEGAFLIFVGALVVLVTAIDHTATVARGAYILSSIGLIGMAIVSLFTGFRVDFLPYKLCPFIFTASAVLILAGTLI